MSLPAWTSAGLLPAGVHPGLMSDVYDRLVLDAPNRERREVLFHALATYLGLVRDFVPHGKAWVDGGFVMAKEGPPHDVDVAVIPSDWDGMATLDQQHQVDLLGLLTLQDVIVGMPGPQWIERVQPIGGALDGFLVRPEDESYWFSVWSSVKRDGVVQADETKGFVEVSW